MVSPESNSRYTLLPRASEDTDRESSPHEHLLPTMNINAKNFPTTYSITLNPVLVLRIISTILALTTFIILVVDGGDAFIAADIFLMSIIIVNVLMVIHHGISHVFKVTVELRQQVWKPSLTSNNKPKISMYFDAILSIILMICLLIGNAVRSHRWGGAWRDAVIVGYFVVGIQVLLAVPTLDYKSLTLSAKFNDLKGKPTPDTKTFPVVDEMERGSARRRTMESEEPRQSAEDLV